MVSIRNSRLPKDTMQVHDADVIEECFGRDGL